MRHATVMLALILAVPPASAGCAVGSLPAVLCTTGGKAAQFGAFYRDAPHSDWGPITADVIYANGCTSVPRQGIAVFPTGSRYVVQSIIPGKDIEVVRIEVEGLPPVYVAARNLTGDCRPRR